MKNLKPFIKKLLSKILLAFESYCRLSAVFFLLLFLTGSYEIIAAVLSKVEKLPFLPVAGSVLLNYLLYWLRTFIILLIPYLLIYVFSKKSASIFFIFSATVLLLLQLALIQYFNKSMVPLGADCLLTQSQILNKHSALQEV